MAYETRDNSGVLFNDVKKSDKSPDMTGKVMVNGKEMRVSAWKKQGARGEFISLAFSEPRAGELKPKNTGTPPRMPQSKAAAAVEAIDDEIPF